MMMMRCAVASGCKQPALASCSTKPVTSRPMQLSASRSRLQCRWLPCKASAGERAAPLPDNDPDNDPADPSTTSGRGNGSGARRAVAIPLGVPSAGAVFMAAGFLKILIMCYPLSVIAISMYVHGYAEVGLWAVLKMLPVGLGFAALAKALVDRGLHKRVWVQRAIVAGSVLALVLSKWLFARPRPSPYITRSMLAAQQEQVAAQADMGEAQRAMLAARQAMREQQDRYLAEQQQQQGSGAAPAPKQQRSSGWRRK